MRLLLGLFSLILVQLPAFAGPDDLAVIIANKRYDFAHAVEYADRDGEAMRDFAERALAIPRNRVVVIHDASLARLRTLFGTATRPGEIAARLAGRKAQRVWIYYSGHGVPGKRADGSFEPYLLPKDAGHPQQPEHSAVALDEIEAAVRAAVTAHAKGAQTVMILDACFSGRSESDTAVADAKGRVLSAESSAGGPVRLVPRKASEELIVLAAARDDEIASWDRDARHGLFTDLLLQALFNGTGEGKSVTVGAIEKFLGQRTNERLAALFPAGGRMQRPDLRGRRDVVLVDNAGTITRDEAARRQAMVQCSGLVHSPDAKAIGEFLASPLCARGCDAACRTALTERRRTIEREAAECADLAQGLDALVKARQPKSVLEAALKDVPARCTAARGLAAAAMEQGANPAPNAPPKGSDPAPKVAAIESKRPAAGADPALAVVPGSGQSFRDCYDTDPVKNRTCPEMVVVQAGSFVMGSPASEKLRDADEGPQRTVTIRQPFAVGKFEVTFDEWDACVASGGCASNKHPGDNGWGRGRRPVINVSWNDAQQYVAWLSTKTGKSYRLLTEAEWEYAARAGTTTRFSFGDSESQLGQYAWFNTNSGSRTNPVGGKRANAWGLHDMHGNVWEWVADCWQGTYNGAPQDGSAWTTGDCSRRVLRGGSWNLNPQYLRAAIRGGLASDLRKYHVDFGFRLARTIDAVPAAPQQSGSAPMPAPPKVSDTAPKAPPVDPKRRATGPDPARDITPGSRAFFRDRLGDGSDCAFCPSMVVVPAGEFAMGSTEAEIKAAIRAGKDEQPISERPQHPVSIAKAFAVGRHEVTFATWDACVEAKSCTHIPDDGGAGRGEQPVVNVSWNDAKQFVEWLSTVTGKQYRLLTEAEWEYAARASRKTLSQVQINLEAWHAKNSEGSARPVGMKRANRWGLHDMLGNLSEWVEDCWHGVYTGAPADGTAWTDGACTAHVRRGGSFEDGPPQVRASSRIASSPDVRLPTVGFRVARDIEP